MKHGLILIRVRSNRPGADQGTVRQENRKGFAPAQLDIDQDAGSLQALLKIKLGLGSSIVQVDNVVVSSKQNSSRNLGWRSVWR